MAWPFKRLRVGKWSRLHRRSDARPTPSRSSWDEAWITDAPRVWGRLDRSGSCPELDGLTTNGDGPISNFNRFLAEKTGATAARIGVAGSSGINIMIHGWVVPRVLAPHRNALLLDRAAHSSMVGALATSGQEVVWQERRYDARNDVQVPFTAEDIGETLDRHPEVGAVALTSPTYDGFDSPIEAISALCRQRGVMLTIDGAWGPGYGLLTPFGFPSSSIQRGADIVGTSLHKKGLAPSQIAVAYFRSAEHAALMDVCGNWGFHSTSPNYLLIGAAEAMVHSALDEQAAYGWLSVHAAAEMLAERITEAHSQYRVVRPMDVGARSGDPGHVLIHVGGAGLTGFALQAALGRRGFDAEKATRDTLLLLVGPFEARRMDAWLALIADATRDALAVGGSPARRGGDLQIPGARRSRVLSIREAVFAKSMMLPLRRSAGHVSAGVIAVYPPGSALIVPGEMIEQEHVDYLIAVSDAGGQVKGIDLNTENVSVVRTP